MAQLKLSCLTGCDLHEIIETWPSSPYYLKTLFNIVEAPYKTLLNCDAGVVWRCSDGPINSQEYKSFEIHAVTVKISMTEYHHWINGQLTIYYNTAVYGGGGGGHEYGKSSHLSIFTWNHFFEALNGAFEA